VSVTNRSEGKPDTGWVFYYYCHIRNAFRFIELRSEERKKDIRVGSVGVGQEVWRVSRGGMWW